MAVPSTGAITMLGVAQERKYGTYGSGTISSPITMFDLLNGGGANAFPALNECPQPNTPSYSMSGWYGYDERASCGGCAATTLTFDFKDPNAACGSREPLTFYTSSTTPGAPWQDGAAIYSDSKCSDPVLNGWYSNAQEAAFWDGRGWIDVFPCGR